MTNPLLPELKPKFGKTQATKKASPETKINKDTEPQNRTPTTGQGIKNNRNLLKLAIVSTLTFLAASTTSKSLTPTQNSTNCDNAFIARFKASKDKDVNNMVLSQMKEVSAKICSFEWNVYGTCCKENQVNKVVSERLDAWTTEINQFYSISAKVFEFIKENNWLLVTRMVELFKWVDSIGTLDGIDYETAATIRNYMKKPPSSDLHQKYDQDLFYYLLQLKAFESSYEDYGKSVEQCYDNLKTFHRSMFCFTCSGRAKSFIENGRLKILNQVCQEVVGKCGGVWTYVYSLSQFSKAFTLFNKLKRYYGTTNSSLVKAYNMTMGPSSVLNSGMISFDLRLIQALVNGSKATTVSLFLNQDAFVCNNVLAIDQGNSDTAGDVRVFEEMMKEFSLIQGPEKTQMEEDSKVLTKKYYKYSKQFSNFLQQKIDDYLKPLHQKLLDCAENFAKISRSKYIPQAFTLKNSLEKRDPSPSPTQFTQYKNDLKALQVEFDQEKQKCISISNQFSKAISPYTHRIFTHEMDEGVYQEFLYLSKDNIIYSGKVSKVRLLPDSLFAPSGSGSSSGKSLSKKQKNHSSGQSKAAGSQRRVLAAVDDVKPAGDTVLVIPDYGLTAYMVRMDSMLPGVSRVNLTLENFGLRLRWAFLVGLLIIGEALFVRF